MHFGLHKQNTKVLFSVLPHEFKPKFYRNVFTLRVNITEEKDFVYKQRYSNNTGISYIFIFYERIIMQCDFGSSITIN